MALILLDESYQEIGPMNVACEFEVGDIDTKNQFSITSAPLGAHAIYEPGTEWGGIFEYTSASSNSAYETRKGWTWRGLLSQWIIMPPSGSDYKIASGDLNDILNDILSDCLGGFFHVPMGNDGKPVKAGYTITSYQFPLVNCSVLEGLMDMLQSVGYRLYIHAEKSGPGGSVIVYCEAVEATTIESEFNEDTKLNMTLTINNMGTNHLIAMGQGELQNRLRSDLYIGADGSVSHTQYYTGINERQAYYDYGSAQSLDDLDENGTKKLLELASKNSLEVDAGDQELEIGDFATGRNRSSGLELTSPIYRKVLKITRSGRTVEYAVKEQT